MKKLSNTLRALALISISNCLTDATIIKAHFDGITTNHTNNTVSIEMVFNTDDITFEDSGFSRHYTGSNWLNYSLTVNGTTYDYDNLGIYNNYTLNDYATLTNAKPNANGTGTHDKLRLGTHVYLNKTNSDFSQYIYSYSYVDMLSHNPDFLKSNALEDLIHSEYSIGDITAFTGFYYVHYREYDKINQNLISLTPKDFNAFNITNFYFEDITPSTTSVSEPSPFGIFVFCGLLLLLRKQREET